jgi:hypothetical protein
VHNELVRICKEEAWCNYRQFWGVYLEVPRKTMKQLSRVGVRADSKAGTSRSQALQLEANFRHNT